MSIVVVAREGTVPRLLIIDEIAYLPIERERAKLVFQLTTRPAPQRAVYDFDSHKLPVSSL